MLRRTLVAVLCATGLGVVGVGPAHADVRWLCDPSLDVAEDPCQTPLDTTVLGDDGTSAVRTPDRPAAAQRPVDCF